MRERNLLGRGQDLSAKVSWAERRSEFNLSFTEPYFLDRPIAAGFDLFATDSDFKDQSSYEMREIGGAVRFGYRYNDDWRHDFKYSIERQEIRDVENPTPRCSIQQQEGTEWLSMVGHVLSYDTRDSALLPTEGFKVSLSNDLAGLGAMRAFSGAA